jgi:hypothetical protein
MPSRHRMEGEELIRISLEPFHVWLQFDSTTLEIGTMFWLKDGMGRSTCIDPVTRQGEMEMLWSLVGETGQSVSWADEIAIEFTGGARLRIPAALDHAPRGTLRARDGEKNVAEDF